jgi:hypothetical protein
MELEILVYNILAEVIAYLYLVPRLTLSGSLHIFPSRLQSLPLIN